MNMKFTKIGQSIRCYIYFFGNVPKRCFKLLGRSSFFEDIEKSTMAQQLNHLPRAIISLKSEPCKDLTICRISLMAMISALF